MAITSGDRRRHRHEVSDSEEDEDSISPIKRVKLEHARRVQQLSPDEDEDLREEVQPEQVLQEDADTDSEEEEDEQTADARREAEFGDDARNIQAYERSRARRAEFGKGSDAGLLTKLTLVNFMNHGHTTVDFCTRLNFLVGHNGSGKSACLTAIAIALGSKAAVTGRGTGLKDLIRKGYNQAVITLTLNNSGPDAFRSDVYGPNIVIERVISINGSSAYKFRGSREGKIIATKREELTHIVEHFSITIDSPLTVLTQDAARSFLQNATEAMLYKFFISGTGLGHLTNQYSKLGNTHDLLINIIAGSQQGLKDKERKLADLKKKMEQSSRLEDLQTKENRLTRELAWAYVTEAEKNMNIAREKAATEESKRDSIKGKLTKAETEYAEFKIEIEANQKDLEELERGSKPLEEGMRRAQKQLNVARHKLQSELDGIKVLEDKIETRQREVDQLTEKINSVNSARTDAEDPDQKRIREDIAKHENLLIRVRADKPIKYEAVRLKQEELEQAEAVEDEIRAQTENLKAQVDRARGHLSNLERQSGNRLSAFGTGLEEVFKEFDRANWAVSRPLGPLGLFVHLVKDEYKDTITSLLGQLMCAFAVKDSRDKMTCMAILQHCSKQKGYRAGTGGSPIPMIIQHSGNLFNFDNGDLSRYGTTVLSQLKIENEEVLRLLVVQRGVEKNLLAPNPPAANALLSHLHNNGIFTGSVYTLRGFQASGSTGALGTVQVEKWKGNQVFSKDVAADIRLARTQVEEAKSKWNASLKELSTATEARKIVSAALVQAKALAARADRGEPDVVARLARLKRDLEDRDDDNVIDALTETKMAAAEVVIVLEGQIQGLRNGLTNFRTDISKCEAEVAEYERRRDEWAPERDTKRETLKHLMAQATQSRKNVEHWKSGLVTYENKVKQSQEKLEQLEGRITAMTADAVDLHSRLEIRQPSSELIAELKAVKKIIEQQQRQNRVSARDLAPIYKATEDQLERDKAQITDLAKFCHLLQKAVDVRRSWWDEIRVHLATKAKTHFIVKLQVRNFEGRLEFDHPGEKLHVKVGTSLTNTQVRGADPAFKNPKSLSGGERSFSTVALLLAMWDITSSPMRCLDEWDVFLDHVNRGIAANMLIEGARHSSGKQFILITPQDMAGIKLDAADTRVTRLKDPERGQATLDFGQA